MDVLQRQVELAAQVMDLREDGMAGALVGIDGHAMQCQCVGFVQQRILADRRAVPLVVTHHRQQGVRQSVPGIDRDRLFEQPRRLRALRRVVPRQGIALQHAFVGRQAGRRLAARTPDVARLDPAHQGADDGLHHLVLDFEQFGGRPVELLGPDLGARFGVDQLDRDAHAFAHASHAALDHEPHAQLARDLRGIDFGAAIAERRRPRADRQHVPARHLGDDVLADAVAEELLVRITADVGERQHANRDALAPCFRHRPGSRLRGRQWRVRDVFGQGTHDFKHLRTARTHGLVQVDGVQHARIDRQRRGVEPHRDQDAAIGCLPRLAAHPARGDRILRPHHQHGAGGGQFGVDQPVELLARRDFRIPPHRPAGRGDRLHQRHHAGLVATTV